MQLPVMCMCVHMHTSVCVFNVGMALHVASSITYTMMHVTLLPNVEGGILYYSCLSFTYSLFCLFFLVRCVQDFSMPAMIAVNKH